jgi:hypothetical protein
LVRSIGQRGGVGDPQARQPFARFRGDHRAAVVCEQGPWERPLLDGLDEAVHEGLGRFGKIPLRVATEPRAIIKKGDEDGRDPRAGRGQDLE